MTSFVEQPRPNSPHGEGSPPSRVCDPGVPAFLVGVTGYMSLDEEQAKSIESRLRLVFRFLRNGGQALDPEGDMGDETLAESLAELMVPEPLGAEIPGLWDAYEKMFRSWPGLGDVPIAVMCNLAPGVDTIAARVALSPEFREAGFNVRAPLPFPAEVYREASTFVRDPSNPTGSERMKQAEFDDLLRSIGEGNVFPIRLQRDVQREREFRLTLGSEMPSADRIESLEEERDDPVNSRRRHERYYAAGEYLAVTSHLLISVWNGEPNDGPGAAAVTEARLHGPRADVLPTTQGLRQPPGGPALHLYAVKAGAKAPDGPAPPMARLLHPCSSDDIVDQDDRFLAEGQGGWTAPRGDEERRKRLAHRNERALANQRDRFGVFCRIAKNLSEFAICPPHPKAADCLRDVQALLTTKDPHTKQKEEFFPAISRMRTLDESPKPADAEGEFSRALHPLAGLRLKATKASGRLQKEHLFSLKALFLLTLSAAALLHLFSHWHPPHVPGGHAVEESATHEHDADHEVAVHSSESHLATPDDSYAGSHSADAKEFSIPKFLAGCLAAILAGAALLYYFRCWVRRSAELHHDYRAVAEAVRVQFYWNLSGLGQSVSANYMHRQRNELDWIRAAIRSVSFPYEPWRERFFRLPRTDRVTALRAVVRCWIDVQQEYFKNAGHRNHRTLHAWHKTGAALAMTGVILLCICVADEWFGNSFELRESTTLALPVAAIAILAIVLVLRTWMGDFHRAGDHHGHERLRVRLVHWAIPTPDDHAGAYRTSGDRIFRSILGFFARLPVALLLVWIAYEVVTLPWPAWLPDATARGLLIGGVALLAGALSVAWAEKNLLSEIAYQYDTAHSLFRAASYRLNLDLDELSRLAQEADELDARGDRYPSSSPPPDDARRLFETKLDDVQDYLYALGKEALDENAEWLLLHRARPLEPVMAG